MIFGVLPDAGLRRFNFEPSSSSMRWSVLTSKCRKTSSEQTEICSGTPCRFDNFRSYSGLSPRESTKCAAQQRKRCAPTTYRRHKPANWLGETLSLARLWPEQLDGQRRAPNKALYARQHVSSQLEHASLAQSAFFAAVDQGQSTSCATPASCVIPQLGALFYLGRRSE